MAYVAQMLPDRDGALALRKLMNAALNAHDLHEDHIAMPTFNEKEIDALYELHAKLTKDMRGRI